MTRCNVAKIRGRKTQSGWALTFKLPLRTALILAVQGVHSSKVKLTSKKNIQSHWIANVNEDIHSSFALSYTEIQIHWKPRTNANVFPNFGFRPILSVNTSSAIEVTDLHPNNWSAQHGNRRSYRTAEQGKLSIGEHWHSWRYIVSVATFTRMPCIVSILTRRILT